MNTPPVIDFTLTNVWNAAAGRAKLGVDAAITAAVAGVSLTPGPAGPAGPAGPSGPPGVSAFVPTGTILLWLTASPVPIGWHLCDGTGGTPDLHSAFFMVPA